MIATDAQRLNQENKKTKKRLVTPACKCTDFILLKLHLETIGCKLS